jgi:hypothetical protein
MLRRTLCRAQGEIQTPKFYVRSLVSPRAWLYIIIMNHPLHPRIDIAALCDLYAGHQPLMRSLCTTPYDIWSLSHSRSRHRLEQDRAVVTDVFIWGAGDGPDRSLTRLGGMPFLPRSMQWPRRDSITGRFYAQINFRDSLDIVGRLPGDVLLIFKFFSEKWTTWDQGMYEFVWVRLGPDVPLWQRCDVPNGGVEPKTLFGHIIRTYDYERTRPEELAVIAATKIGGVPVDVQRREGPRVPRDWRYIAQVTATSPRTRVPLPAYGVSDAVVGGSDAYWALTHGPGSGVLCLYMDNNGDVRLSFSDT